MKITGKISSDDKAVTATFDAVPWFEFQGDGKRHATDDEDIRLLFRFELPGGFLGGTERADEVAYHCIDQSGVQRVLNYLDDNQPKPAAGAKDGRGRPAPMIGFEVAINRYEALTWLMHNKRHLWTELFGLIREDAAERAMTPAQRLAEIAG